MKRASIAVAVLVSLTLTGCAGTPQGDGDGASAAETSESAAPLVAETTAPETESTDAEVQYLADVRKALTNGRETSIPDATDAQLIQAGLDACQQIADGLPQNEVHVVEGEHPDDFLGQYPESYIIAGVAAGRIC